MKSTLQIAQFLNSSVLVIFVPYVVMKMTRKMKTFGFDIPFKRKRFSHLVKLCSWGIVAGILMKWAVVLSALIATNVFGKIEVQESYKAMSANKGSIGWRLGVIAVVVFGPIIEEYLFRGLFQSIASTALRSRILGLLAVSIVFALCPG